MPWTDAFSGPDSGVANNLNINAIQNRFTNTNNTFKTVYKNEDTWVQE